jgi:CrcB protein
MNPGTLLWIALGGGAGSVARALIGYAFQARFPWGTLAINALGSFFVGWLMARVGNVEPDITARMQSLLVVGFCGGFTTFSTFSWQTLDQMMKGQWGAAVANVLLSVTLCLVTVWLGYRLGRA